MPLFGPPDIDKLEARRNVKRLIKALSHKDTRTRKRAADALREIGDVQAVEPLIAALGDLAHTVRVSAVIALGRLGDVRAVEPLIQVLRDRDGDVRLRTVEALTRIGDTKPVEPLIAALRDEDSRVRRSAADALGQLGDPRAQKPLLDLVYAPDKQLREKAAKALIRLGDPDLESICQALQDESKAHAAARALDLFGWKPGHDAVAAWYWIAKEAWLPCVSVGEPAVGPLVATLRSKQAETRASAIETLGRIEHADAVAPLIEGLKDPSSDVRQAAATALGSIKNEQAVAPLIATLGDRTSRVRQAAAVALGQLGDRRAVEPLVALLDESNARLEQAAATALNTLGWQPDPGSAGVRYWLAQGNWQQCAALGEAAVEPLVAALKDKDPKMRQTVIAALGRIGTPSVTEPLRSILVHDRALEVRRAAIEALGRVRDPRAAQLLAECLGHSEEEISRAAIAALDRRGWLPPKTELGARYWIAKGKLNRCVAIGLPAVPLLIDALQDGFKDQRPDAALALGQIGSLDAEEPLLSALKGRDSQLCLAAVRALGEIGSTRAVKPLIAILKGRKKDLREAAERALVAIGAPAVEPLIAALGDRSKTMRSRAASILKAIGDATVEPLLALLGNRSAKTRQVAAEALVEMYRSGQLRDKDKQLILEQRSKITEDHTDEPRGLHTDDGINTGHSCSFHTDRKHHYDRGIGVEFPL